MEKLRGVEDSLLMDDGFLVRDELPDVLSSWQVGQDSIDGDGVILVFGEAKGDLIFLRRCCGFLVIVHVHAFPLPQAGL